MPKYEVNKDGADQSLDPDGNNAKVTFDNKDTNQTPQKSRTKRVLIIVLVAFCILVVLLLCAWFIYTIFEPRPEWQKDYFVVETIPGLRYHPEGHVAETLIIYNASSPASYKKWADVIDKELDDYTKMLKKPPPNLMNCDYDKHPGPGKVCVQDILKWFPCVKDNFYGYPKGSPCIFLRFNEKLDWIPELYDTPNALPEDMPKDLKDTIAREYQIYYKLTRTVWVSCEGEDPVDVENAGPLRYIPRRGVPAFYFPKNDTRNYLSPVLAIYFEKPKRGVVINIECRIWAKNVEYNKDKGTGFVHFEIMVDN